MPLGQLVLVVLAISTAVIVGRRQAATRSDATIDARPTAATVAGSDTAPASAPLAGAAMGTFNVRALDGALVPLVTPGEPAIVMVSSRTCGWCKRALSDLGTMAGGRPLARLTLLTLEGAQEGIPMLQKEQIAGARLVGPAGSSDHVLLTFRYPGTPTFVAIDRNGRVVKTMPGYPAREELQRWFAVMVGDQDTP